MCVPLSPFMWTFTWMFGSSFWVILSGLYVIIFFGKDWPQSEGSRYADNGIKSPPVLVLPFSFLILYSE